MATRKIVPRADNEGGLGTALKRWASAFINALTVNTIALIGGQIAFPATQAPSADVNTLDDYEEGTWTPTDASGASLAFSQALGHYTKIGRMVFLWMRVAFPVTADGTPVLIGGLPFTIVPDSNQQGRGGVTYATTTACHSVWPRSNTTQMHIIKEDGWRAINSDLSDKDMYLWAQYPVGS